MKAIDFLLGAVGAEADKSIFVSEKEFRSLIEESTRSGVLGDHEKKLIDTILDFERIHVESVMIPVSKVPKVGITGKVGEVKDIARRTFMCVIMSIEQLCL